MARFMRLDVVNTILETGILPLFYHGELQTAVEIVAACANGGARAIEFTNRGEQAYPVFTDLVRHFARADPTVILGVGSVLDAPTAALYLAAGANFIVGPSFNPEIARLCNRRKVLYLPGCATPTEIATAEELGAELCKIFPGETVGGPAFIKAVLAPCPWHRLLPTGGVEATAASITEWVQAGAAAVGLGSKLITTQIVQTQAMDELAARVAHCVAWVQQARGRPLFLGVEHVGLYPHQTDAETLSRWYEQCFGFQRTEGSSSFFLSGGGTGRIEALKAPAETRLHVAILVSDFEAAIAALQVQGIGVQESYLKPDVKAAYLDRPDPDGNLVHILWRARR